MGTLQSAAIFRADAGPAIGSGHLMRCLALAQACKERGLSPTFLSSKLPASLAARLQAEGIPSLPLASEPGSQADAGETIRLAQSLGASWAVIDGYSFPPAYQRAISEAGSRVLIIDDCSHCASYRADCVLNQNAGADAAIYSGKLSKFCNLVLGPSFALLRKEFRKNAGSIPQKSFASVKKILLTLGGGANEELLSCALEALGSALPANAEIILAPGTANVSKLELAMRKSPVEVRILSNPPDLCSVMLECDFAMAGGGSTAWELLFTGVPSILVAFAENQQAVSKATERMGAAVKAVSKKELCDVKGFSALVSQAVRDPELLLKVSEKARAVVDGLGASRIADELLAPRLRDATADDCEFAFNLSNDPEVRKASFSSNPIEWDSHVEWFRKAASSPDSEFYIIETFERERAGQVRFKLDASGAAISLSVSKSFRGKGLGVRAIRLASETLLRARREVAGIHAFIKPENRPSIAAFEKAGYVKEPLPEPNAAPAGSEHLMLRRP